MKQIKQMLNPGIELCITLLNGHVLPCVDLSQSKIKQSSVSVIPPERIG